MKTQTINTTPDFRVQEIVAATADQQWYLLKHHLRAALGDVARVVGELAEFGSQRKEVGGHNFVQYIRRGVFHSFHRRLPAIAEALHQLDLPDLDRLFRHHHTAWEVEALSLRETCPKRQNKENGFRTLNALLPEMKYHVEEVREALELLSQKVDDTSTRVE